MKAMFAVLTALHMTASALAQTPTGAPTVTPPRSPTYPASAGQKPDAPLEQLLKDYEAAFNKGDAKAPAALYTADALRLGFKDEMIRGRAAIEQFYVATIGGGATPKLTVRPGRTQLLTADVALTAGSYQVGDGGSGIYVITAVRQDGQWRLAAVVPLPEGAR